MQKFIKDPLFAFILAGIVLFVLDGVRAGDDADRIDVSQAQIDQLADLWTAQMGRPPSGTELNGLVDNFIKEEIMVREAQKLGLDADDVIIRRRLMQKLTFLTEDIALLEPPSDAELEAHLSANIDRYRIPPTTTFSHIYFSPDSRDNAAGDARLALDGMAGDSEWRSVGDPFMLRRTYAYVSENQIRKEFGTAFAADVVELEANGEWQGPIVSGFGFHLVRVDKKDPGREVTLTEVRDRVRADFDADRRRAANDAFYASLLGQYEVVRP